MKTVFITGATSGLGLVCAQALPGYRVLAGARDLQKGQAVLGPNAELVHMDLASLNSVREAAARLPPLDALVCNAGVHEAGPPTFTKDGIETTFAVNHVAHQLLTLLLLDRLKPNARIVMVSSGTHDPATLEGRANPPATVHVASLARGEEAGAPLSAVRRYTSSKLCNLLFAAELDRRLRETGSTFSVNGFDPGAVPGTELTRSWSTGMRLLVKSSWVLRLFGMAVSTPQLAGAAMARLVTDPTLQGISGAYFQLERQRTPSVTARDAALARALYDDTNALLARV